MAEARPIYAYWPTRSGMNGCGINRHILYYKGVDFEDKSHTSESWAEFKASGTMDFPNLPYLIDGDVKLSESKALTLYICKRWAPELLGANLAEEGKVL